MAEPPALNTLVTNSPFGQPAAPATAAADQQSSALELRGVLLDQGEYFFSLHDPVKRASQWVGLKESDQIYFVESYDPVAGAVRVKFRDQVITLLLKRAQVLVQTTQQIASSQPAGGTPPQVGASTPPSDEAARLAQIAEEIRRRRAIRAQAAGQTLPAQPQSGSGPSPAAVTPLPSNRPRTP